MARSFSASYSPQCSMEACPSRTVKTPSAQGQLNQPRKPGETTPQIPIPGIPERKIQTAGLIPEPTIPEGALLLDMRPVFPVADTGPGHNGRKGKIPLPNDPRLRRCAHSGARRPSPPRSGKAPGGLCHGVRHEGVVGIDPGHDRPGYHVKRGEPLDDGVINSVVWLG